MKNVRLLFFMFLLLLIFPASALAEKVIVIDPGHGGKYAGTCGFSGNKTGYCEKHAALEIGLKLREVLKNTDIKVHMTRSTDKHFSATSSSVDLQERMKIANNFVKGNNDNSLFISIHHNAVVNAPHVRGLETYYYDGVSNYDSRYPPDPMQLTFLNESKRFANSVHSESLKRTGLIDRRVRPANFYVIRHAQMPAVLVEFGFMTNKDEEALIKTAAFQQKAAESIAQAAIQYFKVFEVFDQNDNKLATYTKREDAISFAQKQTKFVKVFDKDKQQFIYASDKYEVYDRLNGKIGEYFTEKDAVAFAQKNKNSRVVHEKSNFVVWSNYIPKRFEVHENSSLVATYFDYYHAESVAKQKSNGKIVDTNTKQVIWSNDKNVKVNRIITSERISGNNRYVTSIELSKQMYPNGFQENKDQKTVILATGDNYADALSAGPLTTLLGQAPILLTKSNELTDGVLQELKRLKADHVVIVGGTVAVSQGIEELLINNGFQVERLRGSDRYGTNLAILERIGNVSGMFVASGSNFADALSAAPIAASKGWGIVLTPSNSISNDALKLVEKKTTILVGGTAAISKSVEDKISKSQPTSVIRLSGANRYDTLANLLWHFDADLQSNSIIVSTGQNFPDALASAPVAVHYGAPLVLTGSKRNANVESYLMYYAGKNKVENIKTIGGTVAVTDNQLNIIKNRLK
ncbi:cell wall-binding repeat-containing protein [Sutcliffiella cohnii]